jgi:peptide/nickel transport system permease protein
MRVSALGTTRMLLKNKKFVACGIVVLVIAILAVVGPFFTLNPYDFTGRQYELPSLKHPLGTDVLGRDLFAQLLVGIQNSMKVGIIAGGISLLIAIAIGGFSGYTRGLAGESFNALINIFLVIPTIPLLILLSALMVERSLELVALFIGLITGWPGTARAIRAQVLSLRDKEFVNLAIVTGKKNVSIIFGEVFPIMTSYIFLQFCGAFASAMLAEAGISLLGLGPGNVATLGMMLHKAIMAQSLLIGIWWWFIPPGLVLVLLASCLFTMSSLMGEKR